METKFWSLFIGLAMAANIAMTAFLKGWTNFCNAFRSLGNRGEAGGTGDTGGTGGAGAGDAGAGETGKMFTQAQLNHILAQERESFKSKQTELNALREFKAQHEKTASEAEQKRLEEAGKYEEAKKGYEAKINEFSQVISKKDVAIKDMQIGFALQNEIAAQNAYPDAVDLIKSMAVVQEDGSIKIKGKDANGIDTLLDVKQGVESFLKSKPYLVKASARGGSGSTTGVGQGTTGESGASNLATLNAQLAASMAAGDTKTASETASKIKKLQASRGISSHI